MRFVREAWPFVVPFVVLALLLAALGQLWAAGVAALLAIGILLFFRDPRRAFDGDEEAVLAAADGLITRVDRVQDDEVGPEERLRIVTFLSVFDVHVQRSPVGGEVVASKSRPGRKVAAFRKDADQVNESHLTVLETDSGERVGVRQIAGLVARRVVPYLEMGDRVRRGDHLGVIKFGSRVDLVLPGDWQPLVAEGDRVRTGATPVARRSSEP
jgi:phosphatidylserine decarboxylase